MTAVRTYSALPAPGRARDADDAPSQAASAGWLPLVGLLVSIPAALAYALVGAWLPQAIAVLAAMLVGLLAGGAAHERGLARWIDGQQDGGAGVSAAATAGLSLLMLARLEILSTIDPSWVALTLVCAASFSRGCAVLAAASLPAGKPGAPRSAPGELTTARISPFGVLWATAWALAPAVAAAQWTGNAMPFQIAAALAIMASTWMRWKARRRARRRAAPGRADRIPATIGAVQAVAEIAFLIGVLAAFSFGIDLPEETSS